MGKRLRLRMHSTRIRPIFTTRPKEYLDLRFWWLHELRQLRAMRRINGIHVKPKMKIIQKELARLRREY